ncbi:MAG: CoA-binding protein [Flavobacteriales bacterium]|jgi:predicted CoA-binding protein|nr:CoA-binding protein [Flavobacteriales bacterium]
MSTTLIIGASNNPSRYSYKAAHALTNKGFSIIPFGVKRGEVAGVKIENDWDTNWAVDTITLYINPQLQNEYQQAILDLKPRRVIFNPGTENSNFYPLLEKHGIAYEEACTLVLLSIDQY